MIINDEHLIDKSKLNIKNKEDYIAIINVLVSVTMKAIVRSFQYKSKEEAKAEFLKEIEFIKYGILKNKESEA